MFFVVSGPSGSGKTTLSSRLVKGIDNLRFVISYTTRSMRAGESNGNDYNFVDVDTFRKMIANDEFAEWAIVHGNYYGTPAEELIKSQNSEEDLLLDINIDGAMNIKKKFDNGVYIFLLPPSMEVLKKRLKERRDVPVKELEIRMDMVKREIELCVNYDYIIVNDELNFSYEKLVSIVRAERCKSSRIIKKFDINLYINK